MISTWAELRAALLDPAAPRIRVVLEWERVDGAWRVAHRCDCVLVEGRWLRAFTQARLRACGVPADARVEWHPDTVTIAWCVLGRDGARARRGALVLSASEVKPMSVASPASRYATFEPAKMLAPRAPRRAR